MWGENFINTMELDVKTILVILGVITNAFWVGWAAYKWKVDAVDVPKKLIEKVDAIVKENEKVKADNEALQNLTDSSSPITQKITAIYEMVEHMSMVQEAKFELENQAYFECDSSGYLIKANDAFYKTLDLSKEKAYGNQWMNVISHTMQDQFIEKWERLVNNGLAINELVRGAKGVQYYITARRKPANTEQAKVILGSISMAA